MAPYLGLCGVRSNKNFSQEAIDAIEAIDFWHLPVYHSTSLLIFAAIGQSSMSYMHLSTIRPRAPPEGNLPVNSLPSELKRTGRLRAPNSAVLVFVFCMRVVSDSSGHLVGICYEPL